MTAINRSPITQYAQLLRTAELGQQKEIKIPIQQARLLNVALTEILDKLNQDYESLYNAVKNTQHPPTTPIMLDGGDFAL